eukprot:m.67267 g.67267  ORF g.67267 m.67267 type:complete len:482 (+) comp23789_c1_seq1:61-1506(+)
MWSRVSVQLNLSLSRVIRPCFKSGTRFFSNNVVAGSKERIVILGSGWGGFHLCRNLDPTKFDIVCISPSNHFLFTPMLPQTAVGTLEFRCIQEPVRTIPNISYHQGKARSIDLENKTLHCEDIFKGQPFVETFDKLIIATGSKTNTFATPGVLEREGKEVFFLKHLFHARQIRNRVLECFERADIPGLGLDEKKRLLSFVIVGGGPTSCEFCAELHDFVTEDVSRWYPDLKPFVTITLVETSNELLGTFDKTLRDYTKRLFRKRDINVQTGVAVTEVSRTEDAFAANPGGTNDRQSTDARLSDGTIIPFGMMVWSAGLAPVKFVDNLDGIAKGAGGRILVDTFLRAQLNVTNNETTVAPIWAIGDCSLSPISLPPVAKVAQAQAVYLAKCFNNGDLQPFKFTDLGSMVQLGYGEGAVDGTHVGAVDLKDPIYKLKLTMRGVVAWLTWRTAYWGKQVSVVNKILIPMHWFKSFIFGRDISRF